MYLHASALDSGSRCYIEEEQDRHELTPEEGYHEFSRPKELADYLDRRIRTRLAATSRPVIPQPEGVLTSRRWNELSQHAETRGGELLGVHEDGKRPVYKWACEHGHQFNAPGRTAKQWWCPDCRTVERSAETVKALRQTEMEFDGVLLSWSFTTISRGYDWRCAQGHKFHASARIVQRDGCTVCEEARNRERRYEELIAIAEFHGGSLLDRRIKPYRDPPLWVCRSGHEFQASRPQARALWCPTCRKSEANNAGLITLRDIAISRNGTLLSATDTRRPRSSIARHRRS